MRRNNQLALTYAFSESKDAIINGGLLGKFLFSMCLIRFESHPVVSERSAHLFCEMSHSTGNLFFSKFSLRIN